MMRRWIGDQIRPGEATFANAGSTERTRRVGLRSRPHSIVSSHRSNSCAGWCKNRYCPSIPREVESDGVFGKNRAPTFRSAASICRLFPPLRQGISAGESASELIGGAAQDQPRVDMPVPETGIALC